MDFLNTMLGFKRCFLLRKGWGGEKQVQSCLTGRNQPPTSQNNPGGLAPSGRPSEGLCLFPPLPARVQGGQRNSRPLDSDRKRQRHQRWCNPNQMWPRWLPDPGGGHCGPGPGPEAGNGLGGTLSGLGPARRRVHWKLLTLLGPKEYPGPAKGRNTYQ